MILTEQQIINVVRKVISEARRNPETNVDENFAEFYNRMLSKAPIEDIFVSFRDSNHVTDVNPVNEYNTPTGYYSYPLSSFNIPKNPTEVEFRRAFPFANHREYISFFILKSHDGILTMETDRSTLNMYAERIKNLYPNSPKVEELCDSFIGETYSDNYKGKSPVHDTHLFWLFLYRITEGMDDGNKQNRINLIYRKVGVNGFVDYGDKFIHQAEPHQAVFFKTKNLGEVFTYEKPKIKAKNIENIIQNKEYEIVKKLTSDIKVITILGKYGLINNNGELITKRRFDYVGDFKNGFAEVQLNGKSNLIKPNGGFLSNVWFNLVGGFKGEFVKVWMNGKGVNLLNKNGELLSKQWFDWVGDFEDGLARLKLNGKWNFIDMNGELLFKQWFDYIDFFEDEVAKVAVNEKWNLITQKGELLSNQWFSWIGEFVNGVAVVEINGKFNLINKNGEIMLGEWVEHLMSPKLKKNNP